MAEVRLRTDFYAPYKITKNWTNYLGIHILFNYKGPAQILNIEVNSGKKGLLGDYDQESPAYYYDKSVNASDAPADYFFDCGMYLNFWGDRQISDCAVEVVIRGVGVYDDAVIFDAYTMNL